MSPVAFLSWYAFGKKGMAALAATEAGVRAEQNQDSDPASEPKEER